MEILTDQVRLGFLVFLCGLLWSLESLVPLYQYQNSRVRHALPNVALTLILVVTNLALSFSSAYVVAFTDRNGVGLLTVFALSPWIQAPRVNYNFSRKLLTSALLQLNSAARISAVNIRFRYIYRPNSDFFVIYNQTSGTGLDRPSRSLQFKLTRNFTF